MSSINFISWSLLTLVSLNAYEEPATHSSVPSNMRHKDVPFPPLMAYDF